MGKWLGDITSCDLCGKSLFDFKVFYDAKIHGGWGIICPECFKKYNGKVGLGLGQEYDVETRKKLRG